MPAMERVPRDRLPWLVLAGLLAVGIAVPMTGSELGLGGFAGSEASAAPSVVAVASPPGPAATETLPPVVPSPSSVPSPTPSTAPSTGPVQALIVPVTQFRATVTSTSRAEVQAPGLPSREQVADRLMQQRLSMYGRRYLRDLRRAAFIDFRL